MKTVSLRPGESSLVGCLSQTLKKILEVFSFLPTMVLLEAITIVDNSTFFNNVSWIPIL